MDDTSTSMATFSLQGTEFQDPRMCRTYFHMASGEAVAYCNAITTFMGLARHLIDSVKMPMYRRYTTRMPMTWPPRPTTRSQHTSINFTTENGRFPKDKMIRSVFSMSQRYEVEVISNSGKNIGLPFGSQPKSSVTPIQCFGRRIRRANSTTRTRIGVPPQMIWKVDEVIEAPFGLDPVVDDT